MKRNKTVKTGILVALLLLVVGFAAVTTNLSLNGTATVGANQSDFEENVQFAKDGDNAPTIASSVAEHTGGTATVSANGKTLTFTTPKMNTLDETVTVTYKVSNQSNYDATIGALSCKIYTSDTADTEATDGYLTVTPANTLSGKDVTKKTISAADTVAVKLAKTYAGDTDATYTVKCTLEATGKSA